LKKDIHIPIVQDVYVAAVKENSNSIDNSIWNVYLINDQNEGIETVIIVSEGFSTKDKTSSLRKSIPFLPKKSYAKLEILPEELLKLTNLYKVSFFRNNQLLDKIFTFKPNTIKGSALTEIPLLEQKGILAY
jgi:hypothetical protein